MAAISQSEACAESDTRFCWRRRTEAGDPCPRSMGFHGGLHFEWLPNCVKYLAEVNAHEYRLYYWPTRDASLARSLWR